LISTKMTLHWSGIRACQWRKRTVELSQDKVMEEPEIIDYQYLSSMLVVVIQVETWRYDSCRLKRWCSYSSTGLAAKLAKELSPCLRVKSASTFFPKMTIMKALLGYLCFSFLKLYVLWAQRNSPWSFIFICRLACYCNSNGARIQRITNLVTALQTNELRYLPLPTRGKTDLGADVAELQQYSEWKLIS
jgi:hypothetical protein